MRRRKSHSNRAAAKSVRCEEVRFAEVEYPLSVQPRLVIQFGNGLSLLVENREGVELAAEFIVALHSSEMGKGGDQ